MQEYGHKHKTVDEKQQFDKFQRIFPWSTLLIIIFIRENNEKFQISKHMTDYTMPLEKFKNMLLLFSDPPYLKLQVSDEKTYRGVH